MTYSAPRHGLFATIILISLTLNVLFFVLSSERQLTVRHELTAQKEALLLSQELSTPLGINDRISISVLANRYIQADDVAFIGVYDINDNLLVPVGKESSGFIARETVTSKSSVLGYVTVQMHAVNRAEIISNNWVYLVSVAFLHAILWLLYGYLAKPSAQLRLQIAHDVRNRLLAKGLLHDVSHHKHDGNQPQYIINEDNNVHTPHETNKGSTDVTPIISMPPDKTNDTNNSTEHQFITQIRFDDPNELLATVSKQTKSAYFSLCRQLVSQATHELLTKPIFHDVSVIDITQFDNNGCQITLAGRNKYSKTALAAIMLAQLVLMLNHAIYGKHRELKRFALPMHTYISDHARKQDIIKVGSKHRKSPLALLPSTVIMSLSSHGSFIKLSDPLSVAERETRHVRYLSLSHVETLEQARDKVLLSD